MNHQSAYLLLDIFVSQLVFSFCISDKNSWKNETEKIKR